MLQLRKQRGLLCKGQFIHVFMLRPPCAVGGIPCKHLLQLGRAPYGGGEVRVLPQRGVHVVVRPGGGCLPVRGDRDGVFPHRVGLYEGGRSDVKQHDLFSGDSAGGCVKHRKPFRLQPVLFAHRLARFFKHGIFRGFAKPDRQRDRRHQQQRHGQHKARADFLFHFGAFSFRGGEHGLRVLPRPGKTVQQAVGIVVKTFIHRNTILPACDAASFWPVPAGRAPWRRAPP